MSMRPRTPLTLAKSLRAAREARDLAILNAAADALNREMDDVLAYQGDVRRACAPSTKRVGSRSRSPDQP
jgi:hypothetical protein